jgi:hypothetical protein
MDYDTSRLAALGKARRSLRQKLDDNRDEMTPEVVAALQAGVQQARIAEMAGLTREWVRQLARRHGIEAV